METTTERTRKKRKNSTHTAHTHTHATIASPSWKTFPFARAPAKRKLWTLMKFKIFMKLNVFHSIPAPTTTCAACARQSATMTRNGRKNKEWKNPPNQTQSAWDKLPYVRCDSRKVRAQDSSDLPSQFSQLAPQGWMERQRSQFPGFTRSLKCNETQYFPANFPNTYTQTHTPIDDVQYIAGRNRRRKIKWEKCEFSFSFCKKVDIETR